MLCGRACATPLERPFSLQGDLSSVRYQIRTRLPRRRLLLFAGIGHAMCKLRLAIEQLCLLQTGMLLDTTTPGTVKAYVQILVS